MAAADVPLSPPPWGSLKRRQSMTKTPKLSEADLMHFTGSTNRYRHDFNHDVVFTEGARYVAVEAAAFWLLDDIALLQRSNERIAAEEFQVWKLSVRPDRTGTLTCEDGNYNVVFTKQLEDTSFPPPGVVLWFANNTIYLPNEH
jgi:hypothetical protein